MFIFDILDDFSDVIDGVGTDNGYLEFYIYLDDDTAVFVGLDEGYGEYTVELGHIYCDAECEPDKDFAAINHRTFNTMEETKEYLIGILNRYGLNDLATAFADMYWDEPDWGDDIE